MGESRSRHALIPQRCLPATPGATRHTGSYQRVLSRPLAYLRLCFDTKEAAAKAAKAEAKVARTAQQAAAKKAKAEARKKQAEAEEAKAAEQTQVEVAESSGRGTGAGETHVYTGRARRASRRATGAGWIGGRRARQSA